MNEGKKLSDRDGNVTRGGLNPPSITQPIFEEHRILVKSDNYSIYNS